MVSKPFLQEKGNTNGQWWANSILTILDKSQWFKVGLRQLSGMLVIVVARLSLKVGNWVLETHADQISMRIVIRVLFFPSLNLVVELDKATMCSSKFEA